METNSPALTHAAEPMGSSSGKTRLFADPARNILVVILGEFCGTFMFLFLAYIGTQTAIVANDPNNPDTPLLPFSLLYIAASFGAAITVNVWIFFRVTGGMFNPAVTLGLVLVGAVTPIRGLCVFITQLVAAIAAAAVVDGILPGPLLVANELGGGASIVQGLFIEFFLTAQLVLTVFFLAVEKHRATYLAPIGIGTSVFIAHIVATRWTGTSINPARSFGPAVVTRFVGYFWIYFLGPLAGAILAWVVYTGFKWLEYETANPGQDDDDIERSLESRLDRYYHTHPPHNLAPMSSVETNGQNSGVQGHKPGPGQERGHRRHDSVMDGQIDGTV